MIVCVHMFVTVSAPAVLYAGAFFYLGSRFFRVKYAGLLKLAKTKTGRHCDGPFLFLKGKKKLSHYIQGILVRDTFGFTTTHFFYWKFELKFFGILRQNCRPLSMQYSKALCQE